MKVKYAAPAATVALAVIAALLFVLLVNDEDPVVPAEDPTPTVPAGTPTLAPTFTPLPATETATTVPTAAPTSASTATVMPEPTIAPTATSQLGPTAVPTAAATPTPVFPSTIVDRFPVEPDTFSSEEFDTIWTSGSFVPRGAYGVIFDGTHLWMRSHPPTQVLVQLNTDGSKTGFELEYGPGPERYFGGPAVYNGYVWMLDAENSVLIRVHGESKSMTSIPIGNTDEPNVRDTPVLFGTGSGLWVRRSTSTATAYDAEGDVLREVSWPFESERVIATDSFVFVEDDSNNEILQLSLDGTELQRIPLGFKPYLLHATDERVYARENAGGFVIRAPTVFSVDVGSGDTIEYTTPDHPDSKKAIAMLETEEWMWVVYNNPRSERSGDVVRFSLDGTAHHRYIVPVGVMASSGDYVWVTDRTDGFSRIPSPQP